MQRKPTKNTRGPNADEKRFIKWTKEQDCICCAAPGPSIVHHCEGSTFKHNKVLVGHWFVIPLCVNCDRIVTQGSRRKLTDQFGPQSTLWQWHSLRILRGRDFMMNGPEFLPPAEVTEAILDWGR